MYSVKPIRISRNGLIEFITTYTNEYEWNTFVVLDLMMVYYVFIAPPSNGENLVT